MLRLGIDTDSIIEPNSPGSPDAEPVYTFDGSDGGQVWIAQQGQLYGLNDFIADSWSAPAFMKTNNSLDNGGDLCGVVDTSCSSGDWRHAYANYLVQYARFYKGVGIPINAMGFVNEPDQNVSYASMLFTPAQALDFIKILGPTLRASELPIQFFCCDGSKWPVQTPFSTSTSSPRTSTAVTPPARSPPTNRCG
jgi:glucuronoarabinoxylan endo-1,4-beta-xylanase